MGTLPNDTFTTTDDNCTLCTETCLNCSCSDFCLTDFNVTEDFDNCTECYDGLWQKEESQTELPQVNILMNGLSDDEVTEEEFGIVPLDESKFY